MGILSDETIIKMHPWVSDPEEELARLKAQRGEEAAADPYRTAFEKTKGQDAPVKDGEGDAETE